MFVLEEKKKCAASIVEKSWRKQEMTYKIELNIFDIVQCDSCQLAWSIGVWVFDENLSSQIVSFVFDRFVISGILFNQSWYHS
jgi:hypothetical protein